MKKAKGQIVLLVLLMFLSALLPAKSYSQVINCDISIDTPMPLCPGIYFELSVFEDEHYKFEWQEQSGASWVTVGNESVYGTSIEDSATYRVIVIDTIAMDTCGKDVVFGVGVRPVINIEFEQLQLTCTNGDNANGNSAKVRATASGAFEPDEYHYFWDIPPLQIAPGDSTLALDLKAHQFYTITVVDNFGCPKTEQFWTEAYDNPEVEVYADPDTAYIQNPFVTYSFINLSEDSIPITNHFWLFSDTIPDTEWLTSDLAEPTYEYGALGEFYTILTVYNPEGCDTTFTKFIDVKPVELFVPNVFTPGTGDETNEWFEIVTEEDRKSAGGGTEGLLQKYYLKSILVVFNRAGRTVYKSDNYNNRWDGGELPDGVYYYVLECQGKKSTDIFKGSVTIIRGN